MDLKQVSIPSIYLSSSDFKFFRDWFVNSLTKIHYDTEHFFDLYDPLRCPKELLWMLADTMGFKFDDRLPTSINRLILLYFMTMIRNRGSRDGVALAAEVNLAQLPILDAAVDNEILYNRLENPSIPVNSVYVNPHVEEGYIDIVYFSTRIPTDACIEYVRPLGMYCFQYAGVQYDSKTRVSIDARLTDTRELGESIGSTRVGHYSREDYARMQKQKDQYAYPGYAAYPTHDRAPVYYRNGVYESAHGGAQINAGLRSLYSLQLCNNEHIVQSLLQPIFGLGYNPRRDDTLYQDDYVVLEFEKSVNPNEPDPSPYNLRYDRVFEESITPDVYTVEPGSTSLNPIPKVNPPMFGVGEAIPYGVDPVTSDTIYTPNTPNSN